MPALLTLILLLVPAPKNLPPKVDPLIGAWALDWGSIEQTTFLFADNTCDSCRFGCGLWSVDSDGAIWFSEQNNQAQYVMSIDWQTGEGVGWRWDRETGLCGGQVQVKIRRGERLMMPREIQ